MHFGEVDEVNLGSLPVTQVQLLYTKFTYRIMFMYGGVSDLICKLYPATSKLSVIE